MPLSLPRLTVPLTDPVSLFPLLDPSHWPPLRKFRQWQIGIVIFILGNLANFASFGKSVDEWSLR